MSQTPSLVTTPSKLEKFVHGTLQAGLHLERRFEPFFVRPSTPFFANRPPGCFRR